MYKRDFKSSERKQRKIAKWSKKVYRKWRDELLRKVELKYKTKDSEN